MFCSDNSIEFRTTATILSKDVCSACIKAESFQVALDQNTNASTNKADYSIRSLRVESKFNTWRLNTLKLEDSSLATAKDISGTMDINAGSDTFRLSPNSNRVGSVECKIESNSAYPSYHKVTCAKFKDLYSYGNIQSKFHPELSGHLGNRCLSISDKRSITGRRYTTGFVNRIKMFW